MCALSDGSMPSGCKSGSAIPLNSIEPDFNDFARAEDSFNRTGVSMHTMCLIKFQAAATAGAPIRIFTAATVGASSVILTAAALSASAQQFAPANGVGNAGSPGNQTRHTQAGAVRVDAPVHAYSGNTANQHPAHNGHELEQARTALMAPGTVDNAPVPSGNFSFGFPNLPSTTYRGVTTDTAAANGSRPPSFGAKLPPTSTSSVDLNSRDMPFLKSCKSCGGGSCQKCGGAACPQCGGGSAMSELPMKELRYVPRQTYQYSPPMQSPQISGNSGSGF